MAFMLKLPVLDTRSVLDVAQENFEKAQLKTYAVRIIYTGEHTLSKEEITEHFKKSVNDVNSGYVEIPVHGILLVYDSYFIHILEGSEDTLHRQLRFLFKNEENWIQEMNQKDIEEAEAAALEAEEAAGAEGLAAILEEETPEKPERKMFKKMKILMVYHSITTRMFNDWSSVGGRPPSLVGKLDLYAPINEHMEQLRICIDKLNKLMELAKLYGPSLSFEGLSANDPKMEALPEVALLDYLINSQHLLDLRDTLYLHRRVDDYAFYFELVWPLPHQFTPRHLYKLKIDDSFVEPLPVMPWEIKKKEEDEEREGDQQQSGSSSSD